MTKIGINDIIKDVCVEATQEFLKYIRNVIKNMNLPKG